MSTSQTIFIPKAAFRAIAALTLAILLAFGWQAARAQAPQPPVQEAVAAPAATAVPPGEDVSAAEAADVADPAAVSPGADVYAPMAPTPGKGMPVDGGIDVQDQYSPIGHYARGLHFGLFWVMVAISLFVLGLLLYVVLRFNRRANPVPSRTTHHTWLEVAWTLVPVLILVAIAVPSITLLARQYETPPEDAITVKATGYQWYWGYTFPDNGGFEIISNMLDEEASAAAGEPSHLGVDNRLVLPAGVPIRMQVTAADVIHSFAVPSLWFKIDAVPGRLNERLLTIEEPGVYYGQCSELCGARHGYMPIAIEALPMDQWRAWVLAQGGTFGDEPEAPEAAPQQVPESALPGAPGAGAPPAEAAPAA